MAQTVKSLSGMQEPGRLQSRIENIKKMIK